MTTATAAPQRPTPGRGRGADLRRLPPLPGQVISWPAAHAVPTTQGTLALDLDSDPPVIDPSPALAAVADTVSAAGLTAAPDGTVAHPDSAGAVGTVEAAARAMRARAGRFSMAVVEVIAGERPATQLLRWVAPDVYDAVVEATAASATPSDAETRARTERPRLVSVHVRAVDTHVAEACSHVRHGQRGRALALRLEQRDQRWMCTALAMG